MRKKERWRETEAVGDGTEYEIGERAREKERKRVLKEKEREREHDEGIGKV